MLLLELEQLRFVCEDDMTNALALAECTSDNYRAGNEIDGTFEIICCGESTIVPYDATVTEMKTAIESDIPNVGTVSVARTEPTGQSGYTWSCRDVPECTADITDLKKQ